MPKIVTAMIHSPLQPERLENSLKREVAGEVFFDPYQRALYSTDASLYQIQPLGVVIPKTIQDVVSTVQIAAEHQVPLVARGGGTSLSGQTVGPGLVIDFSKYLNEILQIDPELQTARVQPGVVLEDLNRAAAKHGLQFGPDVATVDRANLGGLIGNNSAGAHSILYGKTVDQVIALDVLLADGSAATLEPLTSGQLEKQKARNDRLGHIYREVDRIVESNREEIIARFPPILRRVGGYNLDEFVPECRERFKLPPEVQRIRQVERERYPDTAMNLSKLIVGAEGTLACVTEALVHLLPLPANRGLLVLHFDSMQSAIETVTTILTHEPAAVEVIDGLIVKLARKNLQYRRYLDFVVGQPACLMIVEFIGEEPDQVQAKVKELADRLQGRKDLSTIEPTTDPDRCNQIWACRQAGLPLLMSVPGARKPIPFVEDTAVDPDRLAEFVRRFHEIIADHDTHGALFGHASVGCLHIRPMLDVSNRQDLERLKSISSKICELVQQFGGSMSGEHGDGLSRSYLNERMFGTKLYDAFKQIKRAFDPDNIMNPGKVVDGPSPVENLRQGADYKTLEVTTLLDFSREGGLAKAAEMCNGSAVCRKTQSGTMCPSFMVTGDEEHSTRGRANALRLALSGALPHEEFAGQRMFETFDLCLQCKGCKSECPSNVDVAKMKVEFLHHYYRKHGMPWGVRMMGNVYRLNRLGAAMAPVSNWLLRFPGASWMGQWMMGLDRRRPMPRFVRHHFRKWFKRRQRPSKQSALRGPIVLLDDCLTSYCEPGVNRAAVEVLEATGYEVHLAGIECCGRAALSKGMIPKAQQLARQTIDQLLPWARKKVPIVGCEPSCVLTLLDEYLDMFPGDVAAANAAKEVAAHVALIETHLVAAEVELPLNEKKRGSNDSVLLHGHCHQKALVGLQDTQAMLEMIPGIQVETVDSGCCGMAGSFGYEHYDMSMQIGERVLLPAVRRTNATEIIAPGFSCRQQILHGADRQAMHPVQLLADCLAR